jgi:rhamnosyltransferase
MDEILLTQKNKNQPYKSSHTIFSKQDGITSRAIIFAHYDHDGVVHKDTLDLIKKLKEYSDRIIFVSTNITKTYKELVSQNATIIERENYGYDFWSYKIGLDQIDTKEFTNILFINNSFIVTNPELFCEEYFSNLSNEEGLKGLTISHQISTHIQSFFIEFIGWNLINSNKFKDWWASMTPISYQKTVIQKYEIGMSQYFSSHGLKLKALFKPSKKEMLLASMRSITNYHFKIQNEFPTNELTISPLWAEKLNPTSLLWFELLQKYHFIKVKTMNKTNLDFNPGIFYRYLSSSKNNSESHIINVLKNRNINH